MQQVSPTFYQFTSPGDMLDGEYMGSRPITWQDGKPGLTHYVRNSDGIYNFNGTYKLNADLYLVPVGTQVNIVYTGTAPTRRGQNPVKLFDVSAADIGGIDLAGLGNNPPPVDPNQQPLPGMGQQQQPRMQYPVGSNAYQLQQQQPVMGGMRTHDALPDPRPMTTDVPPQTVVAYLPDGTPVFGYTPDGSPLDAYGRIIPQAFAQG